MTHKERYAAVLSNADLTTQEKVGYLLAASRVDPNVPELTIDRARALLAEIEGKERG